MWDNREAILERFALLSEEAKERTFQASVGRFIKLEDMLYIWIDNMRRAKLPAPPFLTIAKAKSIAFSLSIPESNFKASWQWLNRFRTCRGLQKMFLHGEGVEINKNDPELLVALKELYRIIAQYDPENVYNMDEIGFFFGCFRDITSLCPTRTFQPPKPKRKPKIEFLVPYAPTHLERKKFPVH